jgi:hypothetical protein
VTVPRPARRAAPFVAALVGALLLAGCTPTTPAQPGGTSGAPTATPVPAGPLPVPTGGTPVCGQTVPGPAAAPEGAITVDPAVDADLTAKTKANPPGTTFWLAPGTHTLGTDQFGQVIPKDGDVYLGAPGAVVDGRGLNRFAFIGEATGVRISGLTVRGFNPPLDQGVVNHDSGDGWIIEHNTIEENRGAGLMAGARQQVRGNCLRNNGQYGLNAYQPGNGITGLVVEGNEIVGNNADDVETKNPGCGCSGGAKFWSVNGADVRGNWVHGNHGPGFWADTNDNDFLIEANVIEDNDGEALFYETSYNLVMRNNLVRRNALVQGRKYASGGDNFPIGAVYLSESGGEPRVPARTDQIEIVGNVFQDNWSGIVAWENADRFCNSPANTSTGVCTRLVPTAEQCVQPGIATPPLYDDCRWKTQRVDVHDNTFGYDGDAIECMAGFSGRMAVLSNYGTYPDWSPYKGQVVQTAISQNQQVRWRDNTYRGDWSFVVGAVENAADTAQWQGAPNGQDAGSTFTPGTSERPCR